MGVLDSKVAFITGIARGQGRSHAIRLAEEGADIVGVDLCSDMDTVGYPLASDEDLKETVRAVEALDRRVIVEKIDVRDRQVMTEFVTSAVGELGRLDIVLANAGIGPMETETKDIDASWADVLGVNLTGVFNTIQATVPSLIAGGRGGSIVLTSSTAGIVGLTLKSIPGYAYSAAKHGVVGLMRGFARDLAEHSIRVNTVHPTGVATPMIINSATEAWVASQPDVAAALQNLLPVEMIEPVDISNAILWLVSDAARYVTGVTLPVDAGFTIK